VVSFLYDCRVVETRLSRQQVVVDNEFVLFYCLKYGHFKYVVGSIDTCLQFLSIKVMYRLS